MKINAHHFNTIFWILISFYFTSCKKETEEIALIFTIEVDSITLNSAVCFVNIMNSKDSIISKGVDLSYNPDFSHFGTYSAGMGPGKYMIRFTGLTPNSDYYIRAFALSNKVFYSKTISFATSPQIITRLVSEISQTTAISGGNFYNGGNANILYKGICWSTNQNPTIRNDKVDLGSGATDFTGTMTSLISNTRYYIRSYAINSDDTIYGEQKTFVTYSDDIIYDSDNNIYNTIKIGSQIWMKEDLRASHYRNGDLIGTTESPSDDIGNESIAKYEWQYQNIDSNVYLNSRVYTWHAIIDYRGVCPEGWHVPAQAEWDILESYLGGDKVAGMKMKEEGASHWGKYNTSTNESGFTALPAPIRRPDGYFPITNSQVSYWTSTENDLEYAWTRILESHNSIMFQNSSGKNLGYTCRCVKD